MYWGLRRYDHVPSVHAARQEVVAMGASLMRLNWNLFHQVCENTNGIVGICEDVGNADPFYRESIENANHPHRHILPSTHPPNRKLRHAAETAT